MNRRLFLGAVGTLSLGGLSILGTRLTADEAAPSSAIEKLVLNEDEWRSRLSDQQFHILREEGTERPFTSALDKEYGNGVYVCAGCGLPLFMSATKYDSGTGWPSFYQPIEGHIETRTDYKLLFPRTEYHCARCGGHQGHVFNDGPAPTGKRYCNNGLALQFIPDKDTDS